MSSVITLSDGTSYADRRGPAQVAYSLERLGWIRLTINLNRTRIRLWRGGVTAVVSRA